MGSRVVDGYRDRKSTFKIIGVDDWLVFVMDAGKGLGYFSVEVSPEWMELYPRSVGDPDWEYTDQQVYDVGVAVMKHTRYVADMVEWVDADLYKETMQAFAPRPGDRKKREKKPPPPPQWRIVGRYK